MKQVDRIRLTAGSRERLSNHYQRSQRIVVMDGSGIAVLHRGKSWTRSEMRLVPGMTIDLPLITHEDSLNGKSIQVDIEAADGLELVNLLSDVWASDADTLYRAPNKWNLPTTFFHGEDGSGSLAERFPQVVRNHKLDNGDPDYIEACA